jgi:hypothetical protein
MEAVADARATIPLLLTQAPNRSTTAKDVLQLGGGERTRAGWEVGHDDAEACVGQGAYLGTQLQMRYVPLEKPTHASLKLPDPELFIVSGQQSQLTWHSLPSPTQPPKMFAIASSPSGLARGGRSESEIRVRGISRDSGGDTLYPIWRHEYTAGWLRGMT